MARFGFVGSSYESQSPNVSANKTINWYVETVEDDGKSPLAQYPTPGLRAFASLGSGPVFAAVVAAGRAFAVSGTDFYEIYAGGQIANQHTVNAAKTMAFMAVGPTQILIVASGTATVFNLGTNTFTNVTASLAHPNPVQCDFCDGYFIVTFGPPNGNIFQLSALEDATTWSGLDVAAIQVFPGDIVSFIVDHRELWFWSLKKCQVYYNSGGTFPFAPIPGAFIEQGCAALASPVRLDNSVFWLGADERGKGIAWRAQGYVPVRVSNHAVEYAWSKYPSISDAVSYSYQDQGHTFWVLYFPTIGDPSLGTGATWVYDAATGRWHERGFWNTQTSIIGLGSTYSAHRSRSHMYVFGKHLVGDWFSGIIYDMSINYLDDDGSLIRRLRRAPHISSEQEWIFHHSMQVDLEPGLGFIPLSSLYGMGPYGMGLYSASTGRPPAVSLRWSDDGAKTWSSDHEMTAGSTGQYMTRVIWRRLGRSRDRVYELVASDPIPYRIVDAYLQASPGFAPGQERIVKQYQKVT